MELQFPHTAFGECCQPVDEPTVKIRSDIPDRSAGENPGVFLFQLARKSTQAERKRGRNCFLSSAGLQSCRQRSLRRPITATSDQAESQRELGQQYSFHRFAES